MSQSTSTAGPGRFVPTRSFDGYPYLITYIVPAFYHLMLLPADASKEWLEEFAARQASVNALRSCLVYGPTECVYLPDVRGGEPFRSSWPPYASLWITDQLEELNIVPVQTLYDALELFRDDAFVFLPANEVTVRLRRGEQRARVQSSAVWALARSCLRIAIQWARGSSNS